MEQKKKIIAVIVLVAALVVGMMLLKGGSGTKLSGTYKAEHLSYYSPLPDEFVFENGYCDIGSFTCTYEYKNGLSISTGAMQYGKNINVR